MLGKHEIFPVEQINQDLKLYYRSLRLRNENGRHIVSGAYELTQDEKWITTYRLKIILPDDYPISIPKFYEIGNRIPRKLENHVNGDGGLCLGVIEQIWIDLQGRFELLPLLERHVRSYFIGATNMLNGKGWPYGERSHGAAGICQFYGEKIDNPAPFSVLDLLLLLSNKSLKGHYNCPCGSGKKLRECHNENIRELYSQNLPKEMLSASASSIVSLIQAGTALNPIQEQKLEYVCRQFGL